MYANSYGGKQDLNGGKVYAEARVKPGEIIGSIRTKCQANLNFNRENDIIEIVIEVRSSPLGIIKSDAKYLNFLPVLETKYKHLWLVNYLEDKTPNYDHVVIGNRKIDDSDKFLRTIIGKTRDGLNDNKVLRGK